MASSATTQPVSVLEGTFTVGGQRCIVTLTPEAVSWTPVRKQQDECLIPIADMLSVSLSTVNEKTSGDSCVNLVYIEQKQNKQLRLIKVNIIGEADACAKWMERLNDAISTVSSRRPKNALVLINPMSGNKKGPKQYREKVAPLLREASMKTHVIITESADHVREIIGGYELTSIDCIVTVGGDGTYYLAMNTLVQRLMREAGLDLDDPENDVPETPMPVGLIPCGSANALAFHCNGSLDIETSALAIARGGQQKLNVQGVWSDGKFISYSFVVQYFGVVTDIIHDTDSYRFMGPFRYRAFIIRYALKGSVRMMDLTIETRTPMVAQHTDGPTSIANGVEDVGECTDARQTSEPWSATRAHFCLFSCYTADYLGLKESGDVAYLDCSGLMSMKAWSRARFYKFSNFLVKFDPAVLHDDNNFHVSCMEYRVRLNNPEDQNGRENRLNIDGEMHCLKQPNFHVKLFPGKMNLFSCVPKDYLIDHSPVLA